MSLPFSPETPAQIVCAAFDWASPSLSGTQALELWRSGKFEAAATSLVAHLRARKSPTSDFTRNDVERLRSLGPPVQEVSKTWGQAFASDLLIPFHSNCFSAMGPEAIFLAPASCYARLADKVTAERHRWPEGLFGVTHGIADLLRLLWPVPDCADEDLVPVLAWALTRYPEEWKWVRIWSERTLSPTGHNWWAHAMPGFWMLAVLFPEVPDLRRFRHLSEDYLERELSQLFDQDGWSKEGSPGYHEFAFLSLESMAGFAEVNGLPVSAKVQEKLAHIAGATWKMLLPDCDFPVFGDWVRGNPYSGFVGQWRRDRQPGNLLRVRAARYAIPECKFVAEALDAGYRASGGSDPLFDLSPMSSAYEALAAREPENDSALPASGYYVMRSAWKPEADALAFTAASIGPRITSHKHSDLLSFELSVRGRRVLVDNGYGHTAPEVGHDGDAQRRWRVSTEAHSTCDVDHEDQSRILGEFRYADHVAPLVDGWCSRPDFCFLSAAHEGYANRANPVAAVRRKIFWLRGEYWIVVDRFTTGSSLAHDYRLHFHSAPGCSRLPNGAVATTGRGGNLLIIPVLGSDAEPEICPHPYPLDGYENPTRITYHAKQKTDWVMVSLLVPFQDTNLPDVSTKLEDVQCDGTALTPWQCSAMTINLRGREDFFLSHHMAWNLPWKSGGHAGYRRLFHSRCPAIADMSL